MTSTTIHRTQATETITVSTVRIREGKTLWYETAVIVDGRVSDPRRTMSKFDAGFEHDETVAWARGYGYRNTKRSAHYDAFLQSVQEK